MGREAWPEEPAGSYLRPVRLKGALLGLCPLGRPLHPLFPLYSAFLLAAMSVSSLFNIVDTVEEFYDSFEALLIFLFTFAFVLRSFTDRRTLNALVKNLCRLDEMLILLGLPYRYKPEEAWQVAGWRSCLVLGVCSLDAYSYTIIPWTSDGLANIFSYYYFYFLFDLVQLQYSTLARLLTRHLALIDSRVAEPLSDRELYGLLACRRQASQLCHQLTDHYSLHLFLVSTFVFCNNTSHAYCMISTLSYAAVGGQPAAGEEDGGPRWWIFSLRGVFIAFRILELVWLVRDTTALEAQASRSQHLLSQKVVVEKLPLRNVLVDLHLAYRTKVDVWACGCFKMDYGLILTMVSAATTYIMILVQYAPERQPEFAKPGQELHAANLTAS